MSMRRVKLALHSETVGGVLFTEDRVDSQRNWLLLATVPPNVLIDLTVGGQVELVLDHEGTESRVVGFVDELSLDSDHGRLQIQGHHGLEPWPQP